MTKKILIENPQTSLVSEIEEAEKRLAILIPSEYKQFLIEEGGGYLYDQRKIKNAQITDLYLRLIFPLNDFEKSFSYDFDEEAKLKGLVGLGATHATISICIGVFPNEHYGKIFLFGWDEGLIFQNSSFNEFIESLEL